MSIRNTSTIHGMLSRMRFTAVLLLCAASSLCQAQGSAAPYVPTPWPIVDELLKLANIRKDDFLIDLGSGDARLVVTAAKRFGASGMGIEIQESLINLARDNARKEGVAGRVSFSQADLFEADLSRATIVTVYLLPSIMDKLVPKLLKDLKPGTRIVSHDYALGNMQHDLVLSFDFQEKIDITGTTRTVLYHYVVPARK